MRIRAYIITCNHRNAVCARTLCNFARTDWGSPPEVTFSLRDSPNAHERWQGATATILQSVRADDSDYFLFLEDDLDFNRHLRHNLINWEPLRQRKAIVASLDHPKVAVDSTNEADHYSISERRAFLTGDALLFKRDAALRILEDASTNSETGVCTISELAQRWMSGKPLYYHRPSLVQRKPENRGLCDDRTAVDFDPDFKAQVHQKKTILINYDCMWDWWRHDHLLRFFPYLEAYYEFVVSDDPTFVIYSVYGNAKQFNERAVRVVIAGEPGDYLYWARRSEHHIDHHFFHFGLTNCWENRSATHVYMPTFYLHMMYQHGGLECLIRSRTDRLPRKDFFCDFIYANGRCMPRIEFYDRLARYKRIECPGPVRHNFEGVGNGDPHTRYRIKQQFQSRCRFSIAYENTFPPAKRFEDRLHTSPQAVGYITEKLVDPLIARSVPIYRGTEVVDEVFNPNAFIHIDKHRTTAEAIERVKMVDQDDDLYEAYLHEPALRNNELPGIMSDERYLQFFRSIFG